MLFADVVHSMDLAAALGAERLREIMAALFDRSSEVVQRYGGTVDKFTGDGIMVLFGAPVALEDHAFRACLAAMGIQQRAEQLAAEVKHRDGIALQLRVGLNSGQVIAGEIGTAITSYTAVGEQVGLAQRMESVAPPGGVMLSESTARLVSDTVILAEPEMVQIKGSELPVAARRLLAIAERQSRARGESTLIGRTWELSTLTAILDEAIGGAGCVVNVRGPAGIGKSRLVREAIAIAADRGVPVFATYCESHTGDIPFHVLARLLRAGLRVDELDHAGARARIRDRFPEADPEDLVLFEDLLAVRDPNVALPDIAADARRRRLTALVNAGSLERREPAVYVIEDAHWIDEVSESMLAEFLAVIPQTPSLVLITYRPEYTGALARAADAQTMALRPLNEAQSSALTTELLGADPSVVRLAELLITRAAGNPFFAEEMVRDLAERGLLHGASGAYLLRGDVEDASVPATLQATIGARIDRLDSAAKRTVTAAAVIGSRFDTDLLGVLIEDADLMPLIDAQLVDQVSFGARPEYAFRHPMIRTVAYESQLRSARAQLHRRLAAAIENRNAAAENAALIAEHLEAAADLHAAFAWHMRAGTWVLYRDIHAAHLSWRRAVQVADRLPTDDPDRLSMRIEPRSLLCVSAFRIGGSGTDSGFNELRELCFAAGDQRSLAIGMGGWVLSENMKGHSQESSRIAEELVELLESIGDPKLTIALLPNAMIGKHDRAEMVQILRLAERMIDLADGDSTAGNLYTESPLSAGTVFRGLAHACLGVPGWIEDIRQSVDMVRTSSAVGFAGSVWFAYTLTIPNGLLVVDSIAERDTAAALAGAEQSGDDLALDLTRTTRGVALVYQDGPKPDAGLELIDMIRERALSDQFSLTLLPIANMCTARRRAQVGDIEGAIELGRSAVEELFSQGLSIWSGPTVAGLVESLLSRGADSDRRDARLAIDRLAALPTDPGYVLHEVWLLRLEALWAQAQRDRDAYRQYRDHYRARASTLGFEGHLKWASEMQ